MGKPFQFGIVTEDHVITSVAVNGIAGHATDQDVVTGITCDRVDSAQGLSAGFYHSNRQHAGVVVDIGDRAVVTHNYITVFITVNRVIGKTTKDNVVASITLNGICTSSCIFHVCRFNCFNCKRTNK